MIPRLLGVDEDLTALEDETVFPAGVVALGRGGAGDMGALLLPDGRLAGLLQLRGQRDEVFGLVDGLPATECQLITLRRPVDLARRIAGWSGATHGRERRAEQSSLADHFADEYLPDLGAAGWSETQTLLVLFGYDAEGLRHAVDRALHRLPPHLNARLATMGELKDLAGSWLTSLAEGQVTIGWWVSELVHAPDPAWPQLLLEDQALRGVPLTLTLHLGPRAETGLVSLEERRLARRGLAGSLALPTGGTSRVARLLIACTVDPLLARRTRAVVEAALGRLGFLVGAVGPARSREILLSCAPLGKPIAGRDTALADEDVAAVIPLGTATMPATQTPADLLPLGLRDDGSAVMAGERTPLLLVGGGDAERGEAIQAWALARVAAGFAVTVVDTSGAWHAAVIGGGGQRIDVGAQLSALLSKLGCDLEPLTRARAKSSEAREAADRWVTVATATLSALCPTLSEDDRGDLTVTLLDLADDHLAGRGKVSGRKLLRRLREQSSQAAEVLAPVLAPSGVPRRVRLDAPDAPLMTVFDASGTVTVNAPLPIAPPGLIVAGLSAAIERLCALESQARRGQVIVLDDLARILAVPAAAVLLPELRRRAERAGAAVWYAAASLANAPAWATAVIQDTRPTGIILRQHDDTACQSTAHWFGIPLPLLRDVAGADVGGAVVTDGTRHAVMQIVPDTLVQRLTFSQRRSDRLRREPARGPAAGYAERDTLQVEAGVR